MNEDRPRQKISVEDLLRIKRAERPPAEFWDHFERELRAKQLAAIVEKRPWWNPLPRAVARVARLHLPLGATAVLAVTFLTIREYRAPSAAQELSVPSAVRVARTVVPLETVARDVSISAPVAPVATALAVTREELQPAALADVPAVSSVRPGEIAQLINGLQGSPQSDDTPHAANPAFRFITPANLAAVQAAEPEGAIAMADESHGFESRGVPARMTEPLAQLAAPQTVKVRNRYLSTALPTSYSLEATTSSPGRMMNHIQGSQLHPDDFSRIEAHGDSLSIKL